MYSYSWCTNKTYFSDRRFYSHKNKNHLRQQGDSPHWDKGFDGEVDITIFTFFKRTVTYYTVHSKLSKLIVSQTIIERVYPKQIKTQRFATQYKCANIIEL